MKSRLLVLAACVVLALFLVFALAGAQGQTVGLFLNEPGASEGYTLFSPFNFEATYLIDNDGRLVNSWEGEFRVGLSEYLLENGHLLRTALLDTTPTFVAAGGDGGRIEEVTWDGTPVWEFEYSNAEHLQHHDIEPLPNGNVLLIAWELKTREEAVAAGRDPSQLRDDQLWPDHIVEVQPLGESGGTIVWEWHMWDHLIQDFDPTKDNFGVVAEHPELIDINFIGDNLDLRDWAHTNSIDYNEELDQIVLSVREFSEIWVIDHSTTSEEAASHSGGTSGMGGDILYRWGNPQTYGAGDADDQEFFLQHDAQWNEPGLPGEGNILVFNNGANRPGPDFSSVDEIVPPVDSSGDYALTPGPAYGPVAPTWTYVAPNPRDFFSHFIAGAQRLPNGNTLIDDGMHGHFFEVTSAGQTVWSYINPVLATGPVEQGELIQFPDNSVFRAHRYAPDYAGLQGQDLTPGDPIELPMPGPKVSETPTTTLTPTITPTPVTCLTEPPATPFKQQHPCDTDGDGCSDAAESGLDENAGGRRSYLYFWDFYDVWTRPPGDPGGWHRDQAITLSDILAIVLRFGRGPALGQEEALAAALTPPSDATSYHAAYDRGPIIGANDWHRAPPDGVINIPDDILGLVDQFGHDCS